MHSLFEAFARPTVRTHCLPIETAERLLAAARIAANSKGASAIAELPRIVKSETQVLAAIAVASPSLSEAISREDDDPERTLLLGIKVLKYVLRMSYRSTPYGVFAGVLLADWNRTTTPFLPGFCLSVEPDAGWLREIIGDLESEHAAGNFMLRWNPEASLSGGRVKVVRKVLLGAPRLDEDVSVRYTRVVAYVHELTLTPIDADVLLHALENQFRQSRDRCCALVHTLMSHTVLLSSFRPSITGTQPRETWLPTLPQSLPVAVRDHFILVSDTAKALRGIKLDVGCELIRSTHSDIIRRLQLDVVGDGSSAIAINPSIAEDAASAATLLLRFTPYPDGPPHIVRLRQSFLNSYSHEEIPLLDYCAQLPIPPQPTPAKKSDRDRRISDYLVWKASQITRAGLLEWNLQDEDIEALTTWRSTHWTTPQTLDIALQVHASSSEDIDEGRYHVEVCPIVGAKSAGRMLGRFASAIGQDGLSVLGEIATYEAEHHTMPVIDAELVYLPSQPRMTNVVCRPSTRYFELITNGWPSANAEHIPVHELVVGVDRNRFYIRWPRRNVYIRVVEGHMLNPGQASELTQFLAAVSNDGTPVLHSFDWRAAEPCVYLPRVRHGRVILRPAQWRLSASETQSLSKASREKVAAALTSFRNAYSLPQCVLLSSFDNRLPLDLDSEESLELLRLELQKHGKHRRELVLVEGFSGTSSTWLRSPQGRHFGEVVVSLRKGKLKLSAESNSEPAWQQRCISSSGMPLKRSHQAPGSEWLYANIYVDSDIQDEMLVSHFHPFVSRATACGLITGAFFVRYDDGRPHIRLRLRGQPRGLVRELLPSLIEEFHDNWQPSGCRDLSIASYESEQTRYGGPEALGIAESVFCIDSDWCMNVIRLSQEEALSVSIDDFATISILAIAESITGNDDAALVWLRRNANAIKTASARFREKGRIQQELVLSYRDGKLKEQEEVDEFRRSLATCGARLRQLSMRNSLLTPLESILGSLLHMHCNRLLGIGHEKESLALGMAARVLTSISARSQ